MKYTLLKIVDVIVILSTATSGFFLRYRGLKALDKIKKAKTTKGDTVLYPQSGN